MADDEQKKQQKELHDIHEELKQKPTLVKPDFEEVKLLHINREKRLKNVKHLHELFDNAQNMLQELTTQKIKLKAIPEEEVEQRRKKITALKETIETSRIVLEEIKDKKSDLVTIAPEEQEYLDKAKEQHQRLFLKANQQLKNFSDLLDEISQHHVHLTPMDKEEHEKIMEGRQQRVDKLKIISDQFDSYGELLHELLDQKIQLQPVDRTQIQEYEDQKQQRIRKINKLRSKIQMTNELIDDIALDLNLPESKKLDFKEDILNKFEVSRRYLKKIKEHEALKLKEIAGLESSFDKVSNLFEEIKNAKLSPIDKIEQEEYEKAKQDRMEDFKQVKSKLLATLDLTATLMAEIHQTPKLHKISEKDLEEYHADKFKRSTEIDHLRNYIGMMDEIAQKVEKGIGLIHVDEDVREDNEKEKEERMKDIRILKSHLDIMHEMVDKIVKKKIHLSKISDEDVKEYQAEKEKRMKEINILKEKLREKNIIID